MQVLILSCGIAILLTAYVIYPRVFTEVEPERQRGALTEELFLAANNALPDRDVTKIYDRYIKPEMSLAQRAKVLRANGFACTIERAKTTRSNDTQLRCIRTAEGSWGCKGWGYFTYQTEDGRLLEARGKVFEVDPLSRKNDRCDWNLEEQAELARAQTSPATASPARP